MEVAKTNNRDALVLFAVFVLLLPIVALRFWYRAHSSFAVFDDEGYFILAMRAFCSGKAIYSEFFTQYGPAFYGFIAAEHALAGLNLTHEGIRQNALILTSLSAAFAGFAVFGMTRSLAWSIAGLLLAASYLLDFAWITGHPKEIIVLLAVSGILLNHTLPVGKVSGTLSGLLAAVLLFVKVNCGILFLTAVFLALPGSALSGRVLHLLKRGASLLAVALPFLLLGSSTRDYLSFGILLSLSAALIVSSISPLGYDGTERKTKEFAFAMLLSFLSASFLILTAVILGGTSAPDLIWGLVSQHIGFARRFSNMPRGAFGYQLLIFPATALVLRTGLLFFIVRSSAGRNRCPRTPDLSCNHAALARLSFRFWIDW